MLVRVLTVLVAVSCVLDVGEAFYKSQPSEQTMEYMKQLRENIMATRQMEVKSGYSGKKDYIRPAYCPLWNCYWPCENFTTCMASARDDPNFCLCNFRDIMFSEDSSSCSTYAAYSASEEDSNNTPTDCTGCLTMMNSVQSNSDDDLAYSCDKKAKFEEIRQCFADSTDGDQCLADWFAMKADQVFEGITLQLNGCPVQTIHSACTEETRTDIMQYIYSSALLCSMSEAELDAKVEDLKTCFRREAGRVTDCDIDNHEAFVQGGGNALKIRFQRVCEARQQAIDDKLEVCGDCSATDRRSRKEQLKRTLRQMLGLMRD